MNPVNPKFIPLYISYTEQDSEDVFCRGMCIPLVNGSTILIEGRQTNKRNRATYDVNHCVITPNNNRVYIWVKNTHQHRGSVATKLWSDARYTPLSSHSQQINEFFHHVLQKIKNDPSIFNEWSSPFHRDIVNFATTPNRFMRFLRPITHEPKSICHIIERHWRIGSVSSWENLFPHYYERANAIFGKKAQEKQPTYGPLLLFKPCDQQEELEALMPRAQPPTGAALRWTDKGLSYRLPPLTGALPQILQGNEEEEENASEIPNKASQELLSPCIDSHFVRWLAPGFSVDMRACLREIRKRETPAPLNLKHLPEWLELIKAKEKTNHSQELYRIQQNEAEIVVFPGLARCYSFIKLHELGQGGFKNVFLAVALSSTKAYALSEEPIRRGGHSQLSEKAVKIKERLNDIPYLVHIEHSWAEKSQYYQLMKLCEGGFLNQYLRKGENRLSDAQKQQIAQELIEGVYCLQEQGYSHLDLKPHNIGLSSDLHVKIADWQGGCFEEEFEERVISPDNTPHYAPPEQTVKLALQGQGQERISAEQRYRFLGHDAWSLGIVLYNLLTDGKRLSFQCDDRGQFVENLRNLAKPLETYDQEVAQAGRAKQPWERERLLHQAKEKWQGACLEWEQEILKGLEGKNPPLVRLILGFLKIDPAERLNLAAARDMLSINQKSKQSFREKLEEKKQPQAQKKPPFQALPKGEFLKLVKAKIANKV